MQGFGIVSTTEQDPCTVGRWRQNKNSTYDYRRTLLKGIWSTCLLRFESHGTLTFVSMLLVCSFFFLSLLLKMADSCIEASQLHRFTSWEMFRLCFEMNCVWMCCVWSFLWSQSQSPRLNPIFPKTWTSNKWSEIHNSKPRLVLSNKREICITCLKLDVFIFLFVWILHWWLSLKS